MILVEHESGDIGDHFGLELVYTDEFGVRVLGRHLERGFSKSEPNRNNHIIALVSELTDVVHIVRRCLGLDVLGLYTQLLGCFLDALPGRLVESAIIDATYVGDEPDLQCFLLGRSATRGTAADQNAYDKEHSQYRCEPLAHGTLLLTLVLGLPGPWLCPAHGQLAMSGDYHEYNHHATRAASMGRAARSARDGPKKGRHPPRIAAFSHANAPDWTRTSTP